MDDRREADAHSLNLIRRLIGRKLIDRAVLLGEARWPGSGPLIRLAEEWPRLTTQERADRLEAIGPAALARLQTLAALQPELAAMLGTLEGSGGVVAGSSADEEATTFSEADSIAIPVAAPAPVATGIDLPDAAVTPPTAFRAPTMDAEAIAEAAAMLERVHGRVQRSIDRAARMDSPIALPASAIAPPRERPSPEADLLGDVLSRRITDDVDQGQLPGLRSAADDAGVGFVELDAGRLSRIELYGRMVRAGTGAAVEAGAFPHAVARPGIVAFVGRLLPTLRQRLEAGYCDIPGTNATVRVHPGCRLVIVDPG